MTQSLNAELGPKVIWVNIRITLDLDHEAQVKYRALGEFLYVTNPKAKHVMIEKLSIERLAKLWTKKQ